MLLLPGSKCLPLFWVLPGRKISPLFLQGAIPKAVEHVNFAAFDRRGLKSFGPPPTSEEEARRLARCSRTRGGVSKDERVENARDVASQLLAQPWVSELWLLGHSEGADVAAGVARQLPGKVSAVALFAGAGITRFFEQTTAARKMEGSAGAAQVLQGMIAMTGAGPAADHDDDMVQALTYGVNSTPLDDLRGLDVPVFVAHGDNDEKVPIEAADAFVAELLRERRRALRYVIVPGVDHGFYDNNGVDHAEAVLHEFLTWAGASDKPRTVEVWSRER